MTALFGTYDSDVAPVATVRFSASAGQKIRVVLTPSQRITGLSALIVSPDFTTLAKFGTEPATSIIGSAVCPIGGLYFVRLYNDPVPGVTMDWAIVVGTGGLSGDGATAAPSSNGRIGNRDEQETTTICCARDGSVTAWTVIDSVGYVAFAATKADLASVPEKPLKNTLVKAGVVVALYRLTTGELLISAAHDFAFVWGGRPAA